MPIRNPIPPVRSVAGRIGDVWLSAGDLREEHTAGETLSGHVVAELVGGLLYRAGPASDPDRIVGLTAGAALAGGAVEIVREGLLGGTGGLTAGATYYLAALGTITTTPPATGLLLRVGTARTASELVVKFGTPVIR